MAKGNVQVTLTAKDEASAKIRGVGKAGDDLSVTFKKIAAAAAAAASAIGIALGKMLADWSKAGEEVYEMAQRTGWGIESLSEMAYVAKQTGTDLGGLETSTKKLSKAIIDASDGMATYVRDFDKLGISVDDLRRMGPEDQFWTVAVALAGLADETERSAIATNLFGRSGTDLLPMLAEGADGIQKMRDRSHEFNATFTEESAKAADTFGDSVADMQAAIGGLRNALVGDSGLGTAVTELIDMHINPAITNLTRFLQENQALKDAFIEIVDAVGKIIDALVVMFGWLVKGWEAWEKMPGGIGTMLRTDPSGIGGIIYTLPKAAEQISALGQGGRLSDMATSATGGYVPSGVGDVNITINGNVMGDEAAIRQLVSELEPYFAENARRSSFAPVNPSGYYAGSSSK